MTFLALHPTGAKPPHPQRVHNKNNREGNHEASTAKNDMRRKGVDRQQKHEQYPLLVQPSSTLCDVDLGQHDGPWQTIEQVRH